jgi:hypothetical protein
MSWRNRGHRTWATSVATAVGLVSILLTPGLANAAQPERTVLQFPDEPFPVQDRQFNDPCGFTVYLEVVKSSGAFTAFAQNGVTHITGALLVRLSNGLPGPGVPTIERNISGATFSTTNADGSVTQRTAGPGLWAFEPGKAPGLPRMAITKGRTDSVFGPPPRPGELGDFTFIGQRGPVEDICAALAAR